MSNTSVDAPVDVPEQEQSASEGTDADAIASAVAQALEEASQPTEEEQATQVELETLQQDTYWVVREYLPKIYGCLLFIIGFMFFAFIYTVVKNNIARHFV